jgi:hypothetical protein
MRAVAVGDAEAVHALVTEKLIRSGRSEIVVLNRKGARAAGRRVLWRTGSGGAAAARLAASHANEIN